MRLKGLFLTLAALVAVHVALSSHILTRWTEAALVREASQLSLDWSHFATVQTSRIDDIAQGDAIFPWEYRLFDSLVAFSDVFRFEIYGPDGTLRMVSDADAPEALPGEPTRTMDDVIHRRLDPVTTLHDGTDDFDRSIVFSKTIVPVIIDQRLAAVLEVYMDQTARSVAVRQSFWSLGVTIGFLVLITLLPVAAGLVHLIRKNQNLRTALDQRKLQAFAAERARTDFLTTISQGLRQPLEAIRGTTRLLKEGSVPDENQHLVEVIESNARMQSELIDDLLSYSEVDTGALQLKTKPCDLHELMRKVTKPLAGLADKKGLTFDLRLEAADVLIETDPRRLRQIVANLVNNAVKYTDTGHVTVRVTLEMAAYAVSGRLCVSVEDTGIGMDPALQRTVFEGFKASDPDTTIRPGGKGLGLALARALAQAMCGDITVESQVGTGTVFTLSLPVSFRTKSEVRRSNASGPSHKGRRAKAHSGASPAMGPAPAR